MPFYPDRVDKYGGMVCFWGHGQTKAFGSRVHGLSSGEVYNPVYEDRTHIHRLRFITGAPTEVFYGDVPGTEVVTASEASDADLIGGNAGEDGTDTVTGAESAILDGQALRIPPGPHRIHVKTEFNTEGINETLWCYQIRSGADDFLLSQTGSVGSRAPDPLQLVSANEEPSDTGSMLFCVNNNTPVLLTFFYGLVERESELNHSYAVYVERLA